MISTHCFLGLDPGITTGLAVGYWDGESWLHPGGYQCDASSAPALLGWLVAVNRGRGVTLRAQVEEFRAGTGAGAYGACASTTRTLCDALEAVLRAAGVTCRVRPAAAVKPWATDKRLERAGLSAVTAGMPHARDAQRHMLFTACHDGGVRDPLSARRA